jgi:hypothetical protein
VASELENFLYRLASDDQLLEQFKSDPNAVLQGTGLSGEDQAAVLSGDLPYIRAHLSDGPLGHIVVLVTGSQ